MKATHTDYLHPKHLRVVTGKTYPAFNIARGDYEVDALCVSPSSSDYAALNRKGLPKWNPANTR